MYPRVKGMLPLLLLESICNRGSIIKGSKVKVMVSHDFNHKRSIIPGKYKTKKFWKRKIIEHQNMELPMTQEELRQVREEKREVQVKMVTDNQPLTLKYVLVSEKGRWCVYATLTQVITTWGRGVFFTLIWGLKQALPKYLPQRFQSCSKYHLNLCPLLPI